MRRDLAGMARAGMMSDREGAMADEPMRGKDEAEGGVPPGEDSAPPAEACEQLESPEVELPAAEPRPVEPEPATLRLEKKHPLAIRWMHWVNFPVLFTMIWSG